MANYDDEELSLTFTFKEWASIYHCIESVRAEKHATADRIAAEYDDEKDAPQIAGLRRRASDLFTLMEDVKSGMKDIRVRVAIARRDATELPAVTTQPVPAGEASRLVPVSPPGNQPTTTSA